MRPSERHTTPEIGSGLFGLAFQKPFLGMPSMRTTWSETPFCATRFFTTRGMLIGELAVQHGLLATHEVDLILREQESRSVLFGELGRRLGLLNTEELRYLISLKLKQDESLRSRNSSALHTDFLQRERELYQQMLFNLSDLMDKTNTVYPQLETSQQPIVTSVHKIDHPSESGRRHHGALLKEHVFEQITTDGPETFLVNTEIKLDELARIADSIDLDVGDSDEVAECAFQEPPESEKLSLLQRVRGRLSDWWQRLLERECPLMDDHFDFHGN